MSQIIGLNLPEETFPARPSRVKQLSTVAFMGETSPAAAYAGDVPVPVILAPNQYSVLR